MERIAANNQRSLPWEHAAQGLTEGYLCAVFFLLPLAVHDTFHDLPIAKVSVFYALSFLYLAGILAITLIRLFRREAVGKTYLQKIDYAFVAFVLIGILSTLRSGYSEEAFLAENNRYQGILTFAVYLALFFAVKRYGRFTRRLRFSLLFSFLLVCLLGILNQMKVDPLGYISALIPQDHARFTSTLGNIGAYGAYCSLLFPVSYYLLLKEREKRTCIIYAVITLIGLFGSMAARTEAALIGLFSALAVLPLLCRDTAMLKRYAATLPPLIAAMQYYALLVKLCGGYPLSVLMQKLLSPVFCGGMFCLCLVLWFVIRPLREETVKKLLRVYRILLFTLLGLGILFVIAVNLFQWEWLPESIAKYLVISAEWGTDRGRIWMSMMELQKSFPFVEKLIGGGIGCVSRWDLAHRLFTDAVIGSAHNEYLQYLLTHGIVGLGCYLVFIGSGIARGLRAPNDAGREYIAGCIAYLIQAFVNIARIFTTPLFLLLVFLLTVKPQAQELPMTRKNFIFVGAIALLAAAAAFAAGVICTTPV